MCEYVCCGLLVRILKLGNFSPGKKILLYAYSGIRFWDFQFSSVQFSRSVVSNSLQPHESQHTRPPCPSPAPGVYSNSCPSSRWCHPAISSSVVPFSSCPQSLPASGSFPMSQLWDFNLAINLQNTELSGKKKKQLKQFAEWCKASILWSPDAKSQLIGKDPDAGKDWGQEKKWGDRGWGSWMALPVQWTWA